MRFCALLLSFFYVQNIIAQDCIVNVKDKRSFNKIDKLLDSGVKDVSKLYKAAELLRSNRDKVYYLALGAKLNWLRGNDIEAREKALKVILSCPEGYPELYYLLGDVYYRSKDYIKSTEYLYKAIQLDRGKEGIEEIITLYNQSKEISDIIKNPVPFNPKVVGGISTQYDEYLPIISPDQELAFFTRRLLRKGLDILVPRYSEEFVISKKTGSKFDAGVKMPYPFNMQSNEGGASITIDNKILYYTKCERLRNGYNNCDIYYVLNTDTGWADSKSFHDNICGKSSWESQPTVSSDGKKIVFSSDRIGGFGNSDLYEINFINGKWSDPVNLGSIINSMQHEKSPFLHADGNTLFFSSNNSPSLGGFDIFYSRKDSLGNWLKPVNIGYPINSRFDEVSLFVTTDGRMAYFASNQLEGNGGWDIYSFDLYKAARPSRVLFLKGNLNALNGNIIEDVEIEIKNINTLETSTIKVKGGKYVSSLTLGEDDDVILTVKKKGYAFYSSYISSEDTLFRTPVNIDIDMYLLEEGGSFSLSDIYFKNNSFKLNDTAYHVILEFADYLNIQDKLVVEINGFTDNVGSKIDNQILSEKRASAVYDLIIQKGVSKERISFNGYGEENPVYDNNSEFGRAKNRRTEFKIIKK
tara:strand:- start:2778 stop:4694 length:1917 start_codon:yes stop_codon:yes gene_type:complete